MTSLTSAPLIEYSRFVDRDMFMRFRGGGVGHASTRDATIPLLSDRPCEERQNADTLEDIIEEELLEDIEEKPLGDSLLVEDELPQVEEVAEGELLEDDHIASENEHSGESQDGSECPEEGIDYDDM